MLLCAAMKLEKSCLPHSSAAARCIGSNARAGQTRQLTDRVKGESDGALRTR